MRRPGRRCGGQGWQTSGSSAPTFSDLPYADGQFDHVFVCYLLEHLADPVGALAALSRVLKEGGSITVIEGDHGSCYFHPETPEAARAWECLIEVQAALGGCTLC